jgi:hypothetical protein
MPLNPNKGWAFDLVGNKEPLAFFNILKYLFLT